MIPEPRPVHPDRYAQATAQGYGQSPNAPAPLTRNWMSPHANSINLSSKTQPTTNLFQKAPQASGSLTELHSTAGNEY
jgi:hypothetical protein